MKLRKIYQTIFAFFVITFIFVGCANSISRDESETSSSKKGRLLFSAKARAASTIMPTGFDFENNSGLIFTLTGILDGTNQTIGTWSDSNDKKAYSVMTSDTSILVDTGNWTFRLSVTKDGEEVLYGNLKKTIEAGNNSLNFGTLNEASNADTTRDSTIDIAKGSVNLKLSFPSGKVKSVTGSLYAVSSDKTEAQVENLTITQGDDTDSVTFSKTSVDAGTYIVAISLYTNDEKSYCTKYTALVVVAPGAESTAEQSLSSLNALYTMTYELNGGTFTEGEPITTSYTPVDTFTLPTPTRTGYEFDGWSVGEPVETTTADYTDGESLSIDEDTTLYARWEYIVTADNIVEKIKEMTESGIIKATGEFSTDLIREINAALKELASSNSDVLVTLDLSEVTGLTKLEVASSTNSSYSFYGCTSLAGIMLPDTITSIEECAFDNCTSLTSVIIPDSVTSIGDCAFYGCRSLTSITIPDSVTSIGNGAFHVCTSLENVIIGNGVTSLNGFSFSSKIKSITIGNSVTSIGESTFSWCQTLTSITIGKSVTSIGDSAFYACKSLSTVYYTGTLEQWLGIVFESYVSNPCCNGADLYINGSKLTDVEIPNTVTSINYAFQGCTSLESVTIPDSVTSIGGSTFEGCTSLTSVTIPDSVTSIGDDAFDGCTSLTSITIPDSVTSILDAFDNCTSLTSVTIPDSVTSIAGFRSCTSLTSITIPDSVTSIGSCAFEGCTSLTSIIIPDSVTSIGSCAFSHCTSLTSVIIPDSVTSIGHGAFSHCTSLENVIIGNGVTSIEYSAFYDCTRLSTVYYTGTLEQWLGIVFGSSESNPCYNGADLYISGTKLTEAEIPDSVTSILDAFDNCTSLTSITIPDSVTSIGYGAFSGCTSLTSVTIPNSVTSIGSYAFDGCTSLTSITIPDSVTSIGSCAFSHCTSLTSVTIPNSVTSIVSYAFDGCTSLTSVTIPDSVTSIGSWAFYGCTSLTSITIPNSVTTISTRAFEDCTSLKNVTFIDTTTWYYTFNSDYIEGTEISSDKLKNTSTAATYLKDIYYWAFWYKN